MTDFVQDLEAELLDAARRRAARRRLRPRIAWRPIAIAVAAVAALLIAALTLRPSEHPATPKPGAFVPPAATPIRACDGTKPPDLPNILQPIEGKAPPRDLAVLRRPYQGTDQPLARAAPLRTWLPVGELDPTAVRRGSVPASYVVPTSDLRTKPLACGGGESRGPGVCVLLPSEYACFMLGEIRAGRAFARSGVHLVGIVPDGVRWVRLGDMLGALAVDNVVDQVGAAVPLAVTFERRVPHIEILNATPYPGRAAKLADELTTLLGAHATAADGSRALAQTTVFAIHAEDFPLASAIAHQIGAAFGGNTASVLQQRFGASPDARIVVVIGLRMR